MQHIIIESINFNVHTTHFKFEFPPITKNKLKNKKSKRDKMSITQYIFMHFCQILYKNKYNEVTQLGAMYGGPQKREPVVAQKIHFFFHYKTHQTNRDSIEILYI